MFATQHRYPPSNRPLVTAGPLLSALCQGRTPEEIRGIGATLTPWQIVSDAIVYKDDSMLIAHPRLMPLAVAAAILGSIDLLEGLSSRKDFFEHIPRHEMRESLEGADGSLALACAFEALSRGRLDILDMLERRVVEHSRASTDPYSRFSGGCDMLELNEGNIQRLLTKLTASNQLDAVGLASGMDWIARMANGHLRSSIPKFWLPIACQLGSDLAVKAALDAGAIPHRHHVLMAAQSGALEAAARLALLVDTPKMKAHNKKHPPERLSYGDSLDSNSCVVDLMARNYESCMVKIAEGARTWHPPSQTWRESTWANFCDERATLHKACLMGLSGKFDTAEDPPADREIAKDRLASIARAMNSLGLEGEAELLAQIEQARPHALPRAWELSALAQSASPLLASRLALAETSELGTFVARLTKEDEINQALDCSPSNRGKNETERAAKAKAHLEVRENLRAALYLCHTRFVSRLDERDRTGLLAYVAKAGLSVDFERRALDESALGASKRGRVLKV